jgi:hypothetical protein
MIFILKFTQKIWSVDLVSRRIWLGLAMWDSSASGLGNEWFVKKRDVGYLFTTPWVSGAYCVSFERDRP